MRVAKAFLVHNNKLLLLKRIVTDTVRPGDYDIPGGEIEADETVIDGLIREIYEETGQRIVHSQLQEITGPDIVSNEPDKEKHVFIAHTTTTTVHINKEEHSEYLWIAVPEAVTTFPHPFYGAGLRWAIHQGLI